jgi:hypothetical protein
VADVAAAGIVTEGGTVTAELLKERLMLAPPEGAGPDRFIVHVLESPPASVATAHARLETLAPDASTEVGPPAGVVPPVPVTFTVSGVPEYVIVKLKDATIPFGIVLEFMPFNMHVYVPESIEQESAFPTALADAPAELVTRVTIPLGKLNVHCRADGS